MMRLSLRRRRLKAFTLIELLIVMGLMALLTGLLLPSLSRARKSAADRMLESGRYVPASPEPIAKASLPPIPIPLALVRSFDATIALTPRLSIGTVEPESIYETKFKASLLAQRTPEQSGESEIELPLPPQVISLDALTVSIDGVSSDALSLRGDKLIWRGVLPQDTPAKVDVTYAAIGKGLYNLQTPPGKILDQFKIELTAHGSDVRMLDLSLQPTSLDRSQNMTKYIWDYRRLMFGRPIALDVLGIAPIDRLGELRWLGPLSIIAFGIVIGLVAKAYRAEYIDKWMLLLVLGLFTGAYPLMYFAQAYISLNLAVGIVGCIIVLLITLRMVTLMGFWLGTLGVTLPAAAIMTLALMAALYPGLQGILLTTLAIGLFSLGMMLAPRLNLPGGLTPTTVAT